MSKFLSAIAALAVAGAIMVPTVSQATESDSVRVSYADLNLASPAGQRVLNGRVATAADALCGFSGAIEYSVIQAANACRTATVDAAKPAVAGAVNSARRGTVTVLDAAALIVTAQ